MADIPEADTAPAARPIGLEPGDWYTENGLMVLTAQYHLRRGVCCGNRCRHCPYDHENVPEIRKETV